MLNVGETADTIFFTLEAAQKPAEYVEAFVEYCNVYNTTKEWKQFLQYMHNNCDKNNYPLRSALETLIDVTKDANGSVRQLWAKGIEETSADLYSL